MNRSHNFKVPSRPPSHSHHTSLIHRSSTILLSCEELTRGKLNGPAEPVDFQAYASVDELTKADVGADAHPRAKTFALRSPGFRDAEREDCR